MCTSSQASQARSPTGAARGSRPPPPRGRWWPWCRDRSSGRPSRLAVHRCARCWPPPPRPAGSRPARCRAAACRRRPSATARSPTTKISGWPGTLRSGSHGTRPLRSTSTPELAAERRGGHAGRPQRRCASGSRSSPTRTWSAVTSVASGRCGPRRPAVPARAVRWPTGRRDTGPARARRFRPGSPAPGAGRSGGSPGVTVWRAISAIAPASSTPGRPAADDDEGQQRLRSRRVCSRVRPARRPGRCGAASRARRPATSSPARSGSHSGCPK